MDELTEPAPIGPAPNRRRNVLLGAVLGATALAGTVVGVGAIAGAQDSPSTESATGAAPAEADGDHTDGDWGFVDEDWAAFDECMADQLGDLWIEPEIEILGGDFDGLDLGEFDPEEFEGDLEEFFGDLEGDLDEFFEDFEALPEIDAAEIAAWEPFEECIDSQIGDLPDPWVDGEEPTDEEWEAYDGAWMAAEEACADLMPEEARAEMEAWEAFDQCLADAGVLDDAMFDEGVEFGPVVHVESGDGFQIVEFGDVPGSVTISGDASGVTVSTDGGVTVLDETALDAEWEAFDAAHEECEKHLPEGLIDDGFFVFDEGIPFED